MLLRRSLVAALICVLTVVIAAGNLTAAAQDEDIGHFGKNRLEFSPVDGSPLPKASGTGIVDYRRGRASSSRWRASFKFSGLTAGDAYSVVVQGRDDNAKAYSELCSFTAEVDGSGSCFWYFRGLDNLDVVQLRAGNDKGKPVLQASRDGEVGDISTVPNRYSPGGETGKQGRAERRSR